MDRIHARVFELVGAQSKAGAVVKLEEWTSERARILDRHQQEVQRLIGDVDRLQRRVNDTLQLHTLELQQWDDGKPRMWKGFGLGL